MTNFGSILRDLRLERDLTQGEIASEIGVSPQAISKWETENGLPDVTQLIPLADFFGVTVDYLLGHDPDKNEREILAHLKRLETLVDEGKWDAQVEENRAMLRKYPKDCRLMVQMCRILWYYPKEMAMKCPKLTVDECSEEIIEWGERVLRESTDSRLREEAIRWLVWSSADSENYVRGRKYAELLTPYEMCRENMMVSTFGDDEEQALHYRQDFAYQLYRDILSHLKYYAYVRNQETIKLVSVKDALRLCEMIRNMICVYFPDGDYSVREYADICKSYLMEASLYAESNCTEERVLEALNRAINVLEEMKMASEKLPAGSVHTAPFRKGCSREIDFSKNRTWILNDFENHFGYYTEIDGEWKYCYRSEWEHFTDTDEFRAQVARLTALSE